MATTVHCPDCGQKYQIAEVTLGRSAKCKRCGQTFKLAHDPTIHVAPEAASSAVRQSEGASQWGQLSGYQLRHKLGGGAMGDVFLAYDATLDREVAIKVIKTDVASDADSLGRFLREARLAARLNHPNAVTVYAAGEAAGQLHIVMELVRGCSLEQRVRQGGPLPWRDATKALYEAAQGLSAAHALGIVHRDVKPANLMFTDQGVTKVVDFGLARTLVNNTQFTQQGMLLGTPAYMAPEQWTNAAVDARADVYALACTYYFLLTGAVPFDGDSFHSIAYQHVHQQLADPRSAQAFIPDGACYVLQRGAQKKLDDRYQTAAEMATALQSLLRASENSLTYGAAWEALHAGKMAETTTHLPAPPLASPAVSVRPLVRQRRKRPSTAVLGGASAALLVAICGATYLWIGDDKPAQLKAAPAPDGSDKKGLMAPAQAELPPQPKRPILRAPVDKWTQREIAEWVIGLGGEVHLSDYRTVRNLAELPAGEPNLLGVSLVGLGIPDEDISPLRRAASLESLTLNGSQLNNDSLKFLNEFQHLRTVGISELPGVTAEGVVFLKELKQLENFSAGGTKIGDIGMSYLADCTQLKHLNLGTLERGCGITDDGFKHLSNHTRIEFLSLHHNAITGTGFRHLSKCTDMQQMWLDNAAITDEGLKSFAPFTKVKHIRMNRLSGPGITDAGIKHIIGLDELEYLEIDSSHITDEAVRTLRELTGLRMLKLSMTQVTDACLEDLRQMPLLYSVDLFGTRVSPEKAKELEAELSKRAPKM
jgi:hypothetical protein